MESIRLVFFFVAITGKHDPPPQKKSDQAAQVVFPSFLWEGVGSLASGNPCKYGWNIPRCENYTPQNQHSNGHQAFKKKKGN